MNDAPGIVDWKLASRIGGTLAGSEAQRGPDPGHTRRTCDLALRRVLDYTGLEPAGVVPEVELVSRRQWIDANLNQLRDLALPLERRAKAEAGLPWPLAGVAHTALGAAAGTEAGALMGYASRRVLGQYQVALVAGQPPPPRMLLIGGNLDHAAAQLGVESNRFLLWVAIHEQTHSVQFASVPWLRNHMADLVGQLLDRASFAIDPAAFREFARRLLTGDPRVVLRDALRGDLQRALAGEEHAAIMDQLQAAMAVIEGYAEHVMDAAAADDDGLAQMRWAMDQRRKQATGIGDLIAKALGLGMKMRQYELGKAWSDAVANHAGVAGLNQVWGAPDALPSLAELDNPQSWLDRIGTPVAA